MKKRPPPAVVSLYTFTLLHKLPLLGLQNPPAGLLLALLHFPVVSQDLAAAVYQQGYQPGDHGPADDKEDAVDEGLIPGGGMDPVRKADIEQSDDNTDGDPQSTDRDGKPFHFSARVLIHVPVP